MVNASTNSRPAKLGFPTCSASRSAAWVTRSRAFRTRRAGLVADWGKIACADWSGCGVALAAGLKVLEWEYVGAGFTGPMLRRDAAK